MNSTRNPSLSGRRFLAGAARPLDPGRSTTVTVYRDFDSLPAGVTAFLDEATVSNFFCSLPWFRVQSEKTGGPGDEPRVYVAWKNGRPTAVLVMTMPGNARDGFGPRVLGSCSSIYTTFYAPVMHPEDGPAGLREIVRTFSKARPAIDIVRLDCLDRKSRAFDLLNTALLEAGWLTQPFFHFGNWYENVAGSLEDYLMRRSRGHRYQIRQRTRKVLGANGRFEVLFGNGDLTRATALYDRVYERSWKCPERYPKFTPALMQAAAASGVLRVGFLFIGEEPAASQIWIVSGGRATIFKVAFDENFRKLEVAKVLTHELLRQVIDVEGVEEIDFGRGDDEYKRHWLGWRRERWGIVAFNCRTAKGLLAAGWNIGRSVAKKLVQGLWTGRSGG